MDKIGHLNALHLLLKTADNDTTRSVLNKRLRETVFTREWYKQGIYIHLRRKSPQERLALIRRQIELLETLPVALCCGVARGSTSDNKRP